MVNSNPVLSDEFNLSIWIFFEANLSSRTRREYYRVVQGFVRITGKDPMNLTQQATDLYCRELQHRLTTGRLSYSTALMRLSVMRTVCEFIRHTRNKHGQAYINYFNDVILPDVDKTIPPEALPTESELNALLQLAEEAQDDTAFMIFSLVMKCGLTSGEISLLDAAFLVLDTDGAFCIQFPPKKRLSRIIKLPPDICNLLQQYIDRHQIFSGALFLNRRGTRMKIRDAERLLAKYIRNGIIQKRIQKPFTYQLMRHAAFKYMLQGGADEASVAQYGGITSKWMSRYRKVALSGTALDSANFSNLSIRGMPGGSAIPPGAN